jgi:hypothetical protein
LDTGRWTKSKNPVIRNERCINNVIRKNCQISAVKTVAIIGLIVLLLGRDV